jgi:membrane protein DedA with SNARE-associated domain
VADTGGQVEQRKIPLPWLLTPIVVMSLLGMLGDAIGPRMILDHPLLQMFMNPRNRWLLAATPNVGPIEFFIVGFVRLLLTDPLGYILGAQYGEGAIKWAKKGMGETVDTVVKWFGKAAPVIIFVAPNLYMCILAGASRMKLRTFLVLNIGGTIGRLILIRLTGDAFDSQIRSVLDWVRQYQWWLVGLSVVVVTIQLISSRRRGLLETPSEIEAEIESLEAEDDLES